MKQEFIRNEYGVDEDEFYAYDAIRQEASRDGRNRYTAQCIGRTIRNKSDYSFIVLADNRFSFAEYQNKLPEWIRCVAVRRESER